MSQPVVLITGANTGLGYQIVRGLCKSEKTQYTILLGGRSISKAQTAVESAGAEFPQRKDSIHPVQIDIEDDSSIENLYKLVEEKYGRVDCLINNAGAQFDPLHRAGEISLRELWNTSWSVNVTSTQVMTQKFIPLLIKSSDPRLMFMASGTSSLTIAENHKLPINLSPEGGWPKKMGHASDLAAYRSSKTGMNMMMSEWHRILLNDGVKVWCISPGQLATGLGIGVEANKNLNAKDPGPAGDFIRHVVEGARDGDCGKVILADNVQPW